MGDNKKSTSKNPYVPSGGDDPQKRTRKDTGITRDDDAPATNSPLSEVEGSPMEGAPGTGEDEEEEEE